MALSADRQFATKGEYFDWESVQVKASTTIYMGAIVAVDATGYALPAADAASQVVMGIAMDHGDNSSGQDGDIRIRVARGVISVNNSASNAVTVAQMGATVYVEDDQTVNKDGGSHTNAAGKLAQLDDDGKVWVKFT